MAAAAMVGLRRIGFNRRCGENRSDEKPRPELARHKIAVPALPAEAGFLCQRFFHQGCRIDKNLDIGFGLARQPLRQPLQLAFHQIMIVAVQGMNRDDTGLPVLQPRHRVHVRPIILRQYDSRFRLRPKPERASAALLRLRHPRHIAVAAFADECMKPAGEFRIVFKPGDACGREAFCLCPLPDPLGKSIHVQKSRSA